MAPVHRANQWLVIGNPENRRVRQFVESLIKNTTQRFDVIAYKQLLVSSNLQDLFSQYFLNTCPEKVFIKIDSPGENFDVERSLIALGAQSVGHRISFSEALALEYDHGRIQYLPEWFTGFKALLNSIQIALQCLSKSLGFRLQFVNTPESIVLVFDKPSCKQWAVEHQLPVTPLLGSLEQQEGITCYRDLKYFLARKNKCRVFIKPAYGSSASGVIAFEMKHDGSQVKATTSIECNKNRNHIRLYNSLKIRIYRCEATIETIINTLLQEKVYIEQWVPKTQVNGQSSDIRMLAIAQQPAHYVVRLSRSPITNLHLANRRGSIDSLEHVDKILRACRQLVAVASGKLFCANNLAFDLLIPKGSVSPKIIEINAFGDLLPNVLHQGLSTQEALVKRAKEFQT